MRFGGVVFGAIFALCVQGDIAESAGLSDCGLHKTDCRELIGKRLWIVIPKWNQNSVELSPAPDNWKNTRKLRSGSFLVKGVSPDGNLGPSFQVAMPNGAVGYVSSSDFIFLSEFDPVAAEKARVEECERRGQPQIGMSPEQAIATCWGKPRRVVKVTTTTGVKEQFVYGPGHILEFESNSLSAIVESAGR